MDQDKAKKVILIVIAVVFAAGFVGTVGPWIFGG